jgi:centromere/kinetochore protein ZW10
MLMNSHIGIGIPQSAEHIERRMVGKDEGKQIATSGNMVTQDWDAAWDSEDEEPLPPGTNRASLEEERKASEVFSPHPPLAAPPAATDDDEAADAWGWGDEDALEDPVSEDVAEPPSQHNLPHNRISPERREVALSETYKTSSMPQPVFKTVVSVFNDGARLTSPECVF